MPLPEILAAYHAAHPQSGICPNSSEAPPCDAVQLVLFDYLSQAGDMGTDGEIRRLEHLISELTHRFPVTEREIHLQNRLVAALSFSTALIIILILI